MANKLPPDVRTDRPFRIIKGTDTMIRTDYTVASAVTELISTGEWCILNASNEVEKVDNGESLAAPCQNPICVWTSYQQDDFNTGQSDAATLGQVTTISGPVECETTFFESTGTFTPGFALVVREESVTGGYGVLDAVDSASASNAQLGAVVGHVVSFASGRLVYRTAGGR
jgi:hypothetical protein